MVLAAQQSQSWIEILLWSAVLIALLMGGLVIATIARRALYKSAEDDADVFTLHGLRKLHAAGSLTDEEYARAKAAVIERARRSDNEEGEDSAERAVRELRRGSDKAAHDAQTDGTLSDENSPNSG